MANFNLTGNKTVAELKKEFNEAFGSKLKVYDKNKVAEDTAILGELGLKENLEFECRSSRTVGSFIAAFAELGLKVRIYTQDEWVAVFNGLTLESTGKVKKNATRADMEGMEGYQREESEMERTIVKVKTFVMNSGNRLHHGRLDAAINNFIVENGIEEVVDIKYSTSMSGDANNFYCLLSAMLIYRDNKVESKPSANDEKPSYAEECRENMRRILEMGNHIDEISEELSELI